MKVYVEPPESPSMSLRRLRDALVNYAPRRLEFVQNRDKADFVVLHVNGRRDRNLAIAERLIEGGKQYAVIQYCVRSTQKQSTEHWTALWGMACVVWSYLDLPTLVARDGLSFEFNDFYYTPLGVGKEFRLRRLPAERPYLIGTSGLSWLTEGVREATIAASHVGGKVFHLGPEVSKRPNVTCLQGMDDKHLAKLLGSCWYVSGLRRTEGFELPAAEGLVCGARPILFDKDHYRTWYGDLAEYIPEGSRQEVIRSLENLFRRTYRVVTSSERDEAQKRFDWRFIILGFWKKCLDYT